MLNTSCHRPAHLPSNHPPVLCIVVDTEEEFNWSAPFSRCNVGTSSIAAQILAHDQIYDRLGIVPTYVVDWPVATTPSAFLALRGLMEEGRCEIGTHLHPWVSPPYEEDINNFNSYTGNLPASLEFEKLKLLTQAITDNFKRAPTVFKAGRYGLGHHTSQALQGLGYAMDASVVPYTSFSVDGGPDFTGFGNQAYWFGDPQSPLLELPVTTGYCGFLRQYGSNIYPALSSPLARACRLGGIAARSGALERIRLTPEGVDAAANKRLMVTLVRSGTQVLTLTYHSPSLAPGNTPYVQTQQELKRFMACITDCLEFFKAELGGEFMGLSSLLKKMVRVT
jgi:hypothetical protein